MTTFIGLEADWWLAICTALLTGATVALGVFTYRLWKATAGAVSDTRESIAVARQSADAANRQVAASDRVGMIQNMPALDQKLRYLANCALFDTRPGDAALEKIPGHLRGYGRLLRRVQLAAAIDVDSESTQSRLVLPEVRWGTMLRSPHLVDFMVAAEAVSNMADSAGVSFLVDRRIGYLLALWPQTRRLKEDLEAASPPMLDPTIFLK